MSPNSIQGAPGSSEKGNAALRKALGGARSGALRAFSRLGRGACTLAWAVLASLVSSMLWQLPVQAAAAAGPAARTSVDLVAKFQKNWRLYVTIPVIAGLLNWATNNLAVKMIFYPMEFFGLKIKTWPETPLGLIGWTGIVPVKAKPMATRMVRMVTSSLIDVEEVFKRLSPEEISRLLVPGLDKELRKISKEVGAGFLYDGPGGYELVQGVAKGFVASFTRKLQGSIKDVWDLEGMVVSAMVQDKRLLVELFQECGRDELKFVVRSGLYFGFLLGIFQMLVWVAWDPWWSLAVGGALVGYLTNLFAIKSIFEPVQPITLPGGFKIQGLFLTRQNEVATAFAKFLSERILTSEKIWDELLYGSRKDKFEKLLLTHADEYVRELPGGSLVQAGVGREKFDLIVETHVMQGLRDEVSRLHPYVDKTLELEKEMELKMRQMSSEEFEGVLHPIFEEDELTLIACGAVLGLTAGFLQSLAPY